MSQTSHDSRSPRPTSEQLAMTTLREAIATLPALSIRARATVALNQLEESNNRRTRILKLVQEALSQLRLDMKYLIFDLEATRRERDNYRNELGK